MVCRPTNNRYIKVQTKKKNHKRKPENLTITMMETTDPLVDVAGILVLEISLRQRMMARLSTYNHLVPSQLVRLDNFGAFRCLEVVNLQ